MGQTLGYRKCAAEACVQLPTSATTIILFHATVSEIESVESGCQRYSPDCCLHANPCDSSAKCLDKWQGHQCRCSHRVHSQRSCPEGKYFVPRCVHADRCLAESSSSPVSLFDEESYVQWRLPARSFYPFALSFEFRTRERQTQVLALEFEVKSHPFVFAVCCASFFCHSVKKILRWKMAVE